MIRFENLTKVFALEGKRKVVAKDVNVIFPTGRSVALLGRNGAGKSTLLKMIAGTTQPSSGRIVATGTISWPVGFAGSFHPELSGAQNCRFIGRIYGVDTDELIEFVRDFAELGVHFQLPLKTYSSGMRSKLSFGVSMGIPFDTYLVDEVSSVGDAAFKDKSRNLFLERMASSGSFVVTHNMGQVRELCDVGIVLEHGQAVFHDDLEAAIEHHNRNMTGGA